MYSCCGVFPRAFSLCELQFIMCIHQCQCIYIFIYTYTHVVLVRLQYFFHIIHHFYLQSFKALVLTLLEHDHSSFSGISTVRLVDPLPLLMWIANLFVQGTRSWIFITTGCAVLFFFLSGFVCSFGVWDVFFVVFVLIGKNPSGLGKSWVGRSFREGWQKKQFLETDFTTIFHSIAWYFSIFQGQHSQPSSPRCHVEEVDFLEGFLVHLEIQDSSWIGFKIPLNFGCLGNFAGHIIFLMAWWCDGTIYVVHFGQK